MAQIDCTTTLAVTGAERGSAVQVLLAYPDALARVSGSALMPQPYGSRGGYRATFTSGVLEHSFVAGFTGQVIPRGVTTTLLPTWAQDGAGRARGVGPKVLC